MIEKSSSERRDFEPVTADTLVRMLLEDRYPSYFSCPKQLDFNRHFLDKILRNFRRDSDEKLVKLMKMVKNDPEVIELDVEQRRTLISSIWAVEYYQSIYFDNGRRYVTDVRQGEVGSCSPWGSRKGEPMNDKRKVFIHSHPADVTFSSPDIYTLFLSLDADKIAGYEFNFVPPGINLLFAVADDHCFMCFPSQQTQVPTYPESLTTGLISSEYTDELMLGLFEKTWLQLLQEFGEERLAPFYGQKLAASETMFPEEVSDLGCCLVNLAHTIELCQRYSIPLYASGRYDMNFRRIDSVSDIYPELA